jgi:hypothetical protein
MDTIREIATSGKPGTVRYTTPNGQSHQVEVSVSCARMMLGTYLAVGDVTRRRFELMRFDLAHRSAQITLAILPPVLTSRRSLRCDSCNEELLAAPIKLGGMEYCEPCAKEARQEP